MCNSQNIDCIYFSCLNHFIYCPFLWKSLLLIAFSPLFELSCNFSFLYSFRLPFNGTVFFIFFVFIFIFVYYRELRLQSDVLFGVC